MPRSTDLPERSFPAGASRSRRVTVVAGGSVLAGLLAFLLPGAAPGAPALPASYPEGPPPGHAGGFGEPTCRECHQDHPLNEPTGTLELEGLASEYEPGRSYRLRIVLRHPEMASAGFQVVARVAEGETAGAQAGAFTAAGDRVQVAKHPDTGVAYVHQTRPGSDPSPGEGEASWSFEWTAPGADTGPVVFHFVGNAGNDDASEFGDRIYADSLVVAGTSNAPPE